MYEETTLSGYWGLPGHEKKWAGTVTYKPNSGIELELITNKGEFGYRNFQVVEVLHGETPEFPHRITLFGRFLLGGRFSASSLPSTTINYRLRADYLLLGKWYDSPAQAVFNSVWVTYTSLRGWMWTRSPFMGEPKDDKIVVEFSGIDNLFEFPICSIESKVSFHESIGMRESGHRLERHNSIRITPESPQCLKCIVRHIDSIRDLLSFLTGFPVETKVISAEIDGENGKATRVGSFTLYKSARI